MNAALRIIEKPTPAARIACPLCFSPRVRALTQNHERSLQRCADCGVTFLFPQPSPSDCTAHFQNAPVLTEGELQQKFENNRGQVLARVAREVQQRRPTGSILDVGCATGVFLGRYFPSCWERWGIDLSPVAGAQAAQNGIQVRCTSLREAGFEPNRFDVITVLDAFYYFPSPQDELAEIDRVLKDDGLLALELPLATSRIWRGSNIFGRAFSGKHEALLDSSDHLFYFTPKSVMALLRRTGFAVEHVLLLPGNRQRTVLRDAAMQSYSRLSAVLYSLSRSRIFLGPRFLVLAAKSQ